MEATKVNDIKYQPPKGEFSPFADEDDYADRGRGWGLFGKTPKRQFWYKSSSAQYPVTIVGFEEYQSLNVLVIEFENGQLSCIHPSYLKEMQSGTFGRYAVSEESEGTEADAPAAAVRGEGADADESAPAKPKAKASAKEKGATKAAAPKKEKIELPTEKVKFSAKLKEFATKTNPFSDTDDEVLLFEEVVIAGETPLVLGDAWCGYSNTLKALGLEVGNVLSFEGKVVDKKFNKEIIYKVNNPSKIAVQ
ncbi:hypothetical protein ACFPPD_20530 [Cohnella suwonensis]|uniref:Uncharacterized protein n=1 Tax=Cohnella suwonensis TaxID=696072 RepID=A0ABW0LZ30_9BACL